MNKVIALILFLYACAGCHQIEKSFKDTMKSDSEIRQLKDSIKAAEVLKKEEEEYRNGLFASETRLAEAKQKLNNLGKFKGKKLMLYGGIHFYDFNSGRISLELQDPDIAENVDEYIYENGEWRRSSPIRLSGDRPAPHTLMPLDSIRFTTVKKIMDIAMQKAKTIEGGERTTHVYFTNSGVFERSEWRTSVRGARRDYSFEFDIRGNLKEK